MKTKSTKSAPAPASTTYSSSFSSSQSQSGGSDPRFKVPTDTQQHPSDTEFHPETSNSSNSNSNSDPNANLSNSISNSNSNSVPNSIPNPSQSQSMSLSTDSSGREERNGDGSSGPVVVANSISAASVIQSSNESEEQPPSSKDQDYPLSSTPATNLGAGAGKQKGQGKEGQGAQNEQEFPSSSGSSSSSLPPTQSSQINSAYLLADDDQMQVDGQRQGNGSGKPGGAEQEKAGKQSKANGKDASNEQKEEQKEKKSAPGKDSQGKGKEPTSKSQSSDPFSESSLYNMNFPRLMKLPESTRLEVLKILEGRVTEIRPQPFEIFASKSGVYVVGFRGLSQSDLRPWDRKEIPKDEVSEELIEWWRLERPRRDENRRLKEVRKQQLKAQLEAEKEKSKVEEMKEKMKGGSGDVEDGKDQNAGKRKRSEDGDEQGEPSNQSDDSPAFSPLKPTSSSPSKKESSKPTTSSIQSPNPKRQKLSFGLRLGGDEGFEPDRTADESHEEAVGDETRAEGIQALLGNTETSAPSTSRKGTKIYSNRPKGDLVPVVMIYPRVKKDKKRKNDRSTVSADRQSSSTRQASSERRTQSVEKVNSSSSLGFQAPSGPSRGEFAAATENASTRDQIQEFQSIPQLSNPSPSQSQPASPFDPILSGSPAIQSPIPANLKKQPEQKRGGLPLFGKEAFAPFLNEKTGNSLDGNGESSGTKASSGNSWNDGNGKEREGGGPKKKKTAGKGIGQGLKAVAQNIKLMNKPATRPIPAQVQAGEDEERDRGREDLSSPIRDFSDDDEISELPAFESSRQARNRSEMEVDQGVQAVDEEQIIAPDSDLLTQERLRLTRLAEERKLKRIEEDSDDEEEVITPSGSVSGSRLNKRKHSEDRNQIGNSSAGILNEGKEISSSEYELTRSEIRATPGSKASREHIFKLIQTYEQFPAFLREDVMKYLNKAKIAEDGQIQAQAQAQSQSQSQSVTEDESEDYRYLRLKDSWMLELDDGAETSLESSNEHRKEGEILEETVLVLVLWTTVSTYDVQLISKADLNELRASTFDCDPWVDSKGRPWKGVTRPQSNPAVTQIPPQSRKTSPSKEDWNEIRTLNASLVSTVEQLRRERTHPAIERDDAIDSVHLLEEEREEMARSLNLLKKEKAEWLRLKAQLEASSSGSRTQNGNEVDVNALVKELKETKKQLSATQKNLSSALADTDYLREQTRTANASASEASVELKNERTELEKVRGQLKIGLSSQREAAKQQKQMLESKIARLESTNKLLILQNEKTGDSIRRKAALWDAVEARNKDIEETQRLEAEAELRENEAELRRKELAREELEEELRKEAEREALELQSEGEPIQVDLSSGRASRSRRWLPPPQETPDQDGISQQIQIQVTSNQGTDMVETRIETSTSTSRLDDSQDQEDLPSSHARKLLEDHSTDLDLLAQPGLLEDQLPQQIQPQNQDRILNQPRSSSPTFVSPASSENGDLNLQTQAPLVESQSFSQTSAVGRAQGFAAPQTSPANLSGQASTPRSSASSGSQNHRNPLGFGFASFDFAAPPRVGVDPDQSSNPHKRPRLSGEFGRDPNVQERSAFAFLHHGFGSSPPTERTNRALPQVGPEDSERIEERGRLKKEKQDGSKEQDQQKQQGNNSWIDNLEEFTQQ